MTKKNIKRKTCSFEEVLMNGNIRRCKNPVAKDCKFLCQFHLQNANNGVIESRKLLLSNNKHGTNK